MYKFALIVSILLIFGSAVFPQTTAPAEWKRYTPNERDISFSFPKEPFVEKKNLSCVAAKLTVFYAYTGMTVYTVSIYEKRGIDHIERVSCGTIKSFGKGLLREKTKGIESFIGSKEFEKEPFVTRVTTGALAIVPRISDGYWIELEYNSTKAVVAEQSINFLNSLQFTDNGVKFGDGSKQIVGDSDDQIAAAKEASESAKYRIISKPRALYTKNGRDANTQGTVRLRVTLLKNGTIGDIEPIKKLSDGLTESAIGAAKQIVFIPKMDKGIPATTIVVIEYSFSIY